MLSAVVQRQLALVFALVFFGLAFDVAAGHFADRVVEHEAQIPGTLAPLACAFSLLLAAAVSTQSVRWFRRLTRASGVLSVLAGAAGSWFHAARFFADLEGEYTWEAMLQTLSVSPPFLAPLAFVGIGAALVVITSERIKISVQAAGSLPTTSEETA